MLDRIGGQPVKISAVHDNYKKSHQISKYLNDNIDYKSVIETWERELGILTDHNYHFPDQSLLAMTHMNYRGKVQDFSLGADYFAKIKPSYIVIGWFERSFNIYDIKFISKSSKLITTIGYGVWRYDVYQFDSK